MTKLIIPAGIISAVKNVLLGESVETCAVLFTYPAGDDASADRLVVAGFTIPPGHAYRERTDITAVLTPEYLVEITNQARASGAGIALVHTHLGKNGTPAFSSMDDEGETPVRQFLESRLPATRPVALVLSPWGLRARELGKGSPVDVVEIGPRVRYVSREIQTAVRGSVFSRQVQALGAEGQDAIRRLTIGIVGLGGTGSLVAQQLAHLGVQDFLLVDPDRVEVHNLNRLVGANSADVGTVKVRIAARHIHAINPESRVIPLERDVVDDDVARRLVGTDFIFCCTDSHSSRAVLNQLAYQYLIPCIDMGLNIVASAETVTSVTGRAQMLAPGLACLTCTNAIDPRRVREELMTPEQRQADPYFSGDAGTPQPAVISLNSTVTSLAVTMFLGAVTAAPFPARFQICDALAGTVRAVLATPDPQCIVCSPSGALARGATWPLPTRRRFV